MIESVLLLGWGAASRRQLQPYVELYAQRGLAAVCEVLDPAVIWGSASMDAELARMAERARALEGELLVHMFSRVGFISYAALLDAGQGSSLGERVAAHVFDSGPGVPRRLTPSIYAQQMASGMVRAGLGDSGLGRVLRPALELALRAQYRMVPEVSHAYASARARFSELAPVVPALCLYGLADELVAPREVECFTTSERRRGARVELCAFAGSRHVQHLRQHPQRYAAALREFSP